MQFYSVWDLFIVPLYIIIITGVAYLIYRAKSNNPFFRFLVPGVLIKIAGAIAFVMVYTLYYPGGDTTSYFDSSVIITKLLYQDPGTYFSILTNHLTPENYSHFNKTTLYPEFWFDNLTFSVIRFTSPLTILGLNSFLATTILLSILSFTGIWKLYLVFCEQYPAIYKQLAFAILFFPSVLFWGSGILKDSYTLCAASWLLYGFYSLFIRKKNIFINVIAIIISIYVLISLKPYIFYAIFLGILLWLVFEKLNVFKSTFLKTIFFPISVLIIGGIGAIVVIKISASMGDFYSSIEGMMQKAVITQDDLRREYYGGNRFDIGSFQPTFGGIISKMGPAIIAGLYRPFIWEARTSLMALSGLENLFLIIFTIRVIFFGPVFIFRSIIHKPFLLVFSLAFALTFAFAIGLATANFGALVRYKIPLIPFFVSGLFILNHKFKLYRLSKDLP